jgi:hypothetical protein
VLLRSVGSVLVGLLLHALGTAALPMDSRLKGCLSLLACLGHHANFEWRWRSPSVRLPGCSGAPSKSQVRPRQVQDLRTVPIQNTQKNI